jgi:streptomycin 6-kinase
MSPSFVQHFDWTHVVQIAPGGESMILTTPDLWAYYASGVRPGCSQQDSRLVSRAMRRIRSRLRGAGFIRYERGHGWVRVCDGTLVTEPMKAQR